MSMYVILTSKPGQFRTEAGDALEPIETWDYLFFGRRRARFVIARLLQESKVRIVEEQPDRPAVNLVPTKFLPHFADLDAAHRELEQLAGLRNPNCSLVRA